MVDFIAWATADPLTVEQAACLWAGIDPSSLMEMRPQSERAAIAPRFQMLAGTIASGKLRADTRTNALSRIGEHGKSLVKRADLMVLAESRGERPAFLFDTMLKPDADASESDPAPYQKNKGGRPAEWDWNTFILEITRIANSPDGLPDTRAELTRIMQRWFSDQFGEEPAKSSIEERIRLIYQYHEQYRKPDSE